MALANSMKPHIRLEQRLWTCRTVEATGYGYDPQMAYAEWWQMLRRRWKGGRV